ncbi:tetratricopeptide repeat protein [Clostridium bowmanii]|uniref:tetratricopeptide repeat protein n=1 Tax=Clostridium bowmanii TaxID=132925 RepID=UPI001C0BBBA9|nr:tetratricopeptide repeat protein [Clostridium bowmanii]MBU3191037.1 tetratricopeptide repeat protein [Clostridium bowmanii]MCA1075361.1 tetratricopeptide repeat protein [Clostridium bowmanii]
MKNNKYFHIGAILITIIIFSRKPIMAISFMVFYIVAINYPTILYYIANNRYSQNKIEVANKYFERMNGCFYTPTKFRISYVYFLMLQGKLDNAERLIKSILKIEMNANDEIKLNLNYSILMFRRNDIDKAIDILMKIHSNNKNTIIYQNLGYFLILKGDYNKALEFNIEALDYNSSDAGIMDNLAQTYYYLEDYNKAIEIYDQVISKKPTFATPYYYYALTLIKQDNKLKAIEVLKKGLDCNFTSLSITTKEDIQAKILELEIL